MSLKVTQMLTPGSVWAEIPCRILDSVLSSTYCGHQLVDPYVDEDAEKLSEAGATAFHNLVAKTLYVSKRARPDGRRSFLTTRVRAPAVDDWRKLSHLMDYRWVDRLHHLILSANGSGVLMWYVDTLFIPICAATLVED